MNTDATTTCLIRPIPDMCRGARGSAALSGGVIYDEAAVWGLGKLRTQVSGYNPAYVTLTPYNFTNATVTDAVTWKPSVYTGVSGAIYTDVTSSGGACASDSYNVADSAYTLISWDGLISSGTGDWPLGGFCSCGGVSCANGSWGYVSPSGGITSPATQVNRLLTALTAPASVDLPATAPSGPPSDACRLFIGVVTSAPVGGFGRGVVTSAVFNNDGSYNTSGGGISVVFPYIS